MVKRSQRVVAFFAAVIILFEVAAVPQKAKAVALTASVVASVAAIMTACGVTYWAASQTDAIDYLGGKIDDYLGSLETVPQSYEDWLGINASSQLFEVVSGGVMRFGSGVANKMLDFVRWFSADAGIESAGPVVSNANLVPYITGVKNSGLYENAQGTAVATIIDSSHVRFDFSAFEKSTDTNSKAEVYAAIDGCALGDYTATITDSNWSYPSGSPSGSNVSWTAFQSNVYSDKVWKSPSTLNIPSRSFSLTETLPYIGITFRNNLQEALSGYVVVEVSPAPFGVPATASVAPSSSVSVPADMAEDESFDVSPSVALTQGMSVDDATDEIFDGVTSADGLTSTGESADSGDVVDPPSVDVSGILEALGNILDAIRAIPGHIAALPSAIASAFNSLLSSIKSVLDSIAENVTSAAESIIDGINAKLDTFLYEVEYGFSAVVSSIHRIGQDVRDALMTWLDDFITDVQSAFDTIKQTVIGIPQNIGQAAQDVISGIQALPGMISDALTDLFVPDEAFVETYVDSLVGLFESRVGILTYPLSLFVQFLHRFTQISDGDHIFRWGAILEPFSGRQVIAAGSYDLDDAVASGPMSGVYSTYLLVVKAIVSFWFLHLCQKKYDQIINRH